MSGSRTQLPRYAAIWLLVVSVTAGLSWGAIARAGAAASLIGAPAPLGSVTGASAAATSTQMPNPLPPTQPPATSTSHATTRPSSSTRPTTSAPEPTRSGVQSVNTQAGQVWAYCVGATPHIRSVVATDGWRFEIAAEDNGRIEVKFEPPRDDQGGEVEVKVRCQSGSPSFSTD